MFIILSQKIDTESTYSDRLYETYHYPAMYRNRIRSGDVFIYYQGNRHKKAHRYYFGMGTIGEIHTPDQENYYAELIKCSKFKKIVPIYLPDGGYVEQINYQSIRKSLNPPWQSSIRPISQEAFAYILSRAGSLSEIKAPADIENLKGSLKKAVKDFYVKGNNEAIIDVISIAKEVAHTLNVENRIPPVSAESCPDVLVPVKIPEGVDSKSEQLLDYCRTMRMSYSYKPLLILAILDAGDGDGSICIEKAGGYFREFYKKRYDSGLDIEKGACIYQDLSTDIEAVCDNITANPVKALSSSGYFIFDSQNMRFAVSPDWWLILSETEKSELRDICLTRLEKYYSFK